MKPLYLIMTGIFCLVLANYSFAQDTTYFNRMWRQTTRDSAFFYRIGTKTATGWTATDYYKSGKVQMTGAYSDDSLHIREGEFVWYDSTGHVTERTDYVHGKKEGNDTYYYQDGKVKMGGPWKNDKGEGEWVGYYPSGKLSAKVTYHAGEETNGRFYKEDGSPNPDVSVFYRESAYPGGPEKWLRYLNGHANYPRHAVRHHIEGMVVVEFMVAVDGTLSNFRVVQSVDPDLDKEAMRLIENSRDWIPAINGGRIVESYKRQPIVFKIPN